MAWADEWLPARQELRTVLFLVTEGLWEEAKRDPGILLENLRLIGPIQKMTGHLRPVIARRLMIF